MFHEHPEEHTCSCWFSSPVRVTTIFRNLCILGRTANWRYLRICNGLRIQLFHDFFFCSNNTQLAAILYQRGVTRLLKRGRAPPLNVTRAGCERPCNNSRSEKYHSTSFRKQFSVKQNLNEPPSQSASFSYARLAENERRSKAEKKAVYFDVFG